MIVFIARPLLLSFLLGVAIAGSLITATPAKTDESPWSQTDFLMRYVDTHWSTQKYRTRVRRVNPFLIPLGAMKKRDGTWGPEVFKPMHGELERVTWSVTGESVISLFSTIRSNLMTAHTLRWECQGRSCGNAAEWASRVFDERLLYGRDEYMRYAAFESDTGEWIILCSAARTADRQYLHIDRLRSR